MSRAHLQRPITDTQGNIVPNTHVSIYENGSTQLLGQQLWATALGSGQIANPFTTSDGKIQFWLDRPQSVRIGLTVPGSTETVIDDVQVQVAPENLVQAVQGFQIVNQPTAGYFLQAGQTGLAQWADAGDLVDSKPTALNQIYSYDFSGGVLDNLTVVDASGQSVTPGYVNSAADTKPPGYSFTQALALPTTGPVTVKTPAMTFAETGTVVFLYRVVSTAGGVGAAMLHVAIDSDLLYVETPTAADLCNGWLLGYLSEIPAGSHQLKITQIPGSDPTSQVLIGPIALQYGNNIPPHDHPGTAANSTRLGTGALAAFAGGTAVGASAVAGDTNATALGYGATALASGTALGASAVAGPSALAAGAGATGPTTNSGWVALGAGAAVQADNAVAIGANALAPATGAVALGPNALTGTGGSEVAVGSGASALGLRSVALGAAASVGPGHSNSIAIGPGAATTAPNQAVIGGPSTTLVVPGTLRQTGGLTQLGSPGSTLGFYGSPGVAQPTVTGSRGGNAVLTALLSTLASMGLIVDRSTT